MVGIAKETCRCCQKNINIGQPIADCSSCDIIIHARCFKKSGFTSINNKNYCTACSSSVNILYNPFAELVSPSNYCKSLDKDDEYDQISDEIRKASAMLDKCSIIHSIEDFNKLASNTKVSSVPLSTLFVNIDGNRSNFDTFAAQLHLVEGGFSAVGLAETNTDPSNKDLYKLDGYN